jgi:CRP/FNR family transcriptional regulator, cyclic AMP receptor protein
VLIAVLDADPELAEAVPASDRERARQASAAPAATIEAGPWTPQTEMAADELGLLVLEGLLTRQVQVGERTSVELLGAGDLLRPWDEHMPPLANSTVWNALTSVRIAELGASFAQRMAPWPGVFSVLLSRAVRRSRWLVCNLAIAHRPRVDERILLLFWQLAHRWGKVTRDGVLVPIPLTHETLARLVGARRPTVTTALGALVAAGRLQRKGSRGWLLPGAPTATLDEFLES